jgi:4-hydroxybenzoate polyprenyltransferase
MRAAPHPVRTWLQLFRAPNLFTVPGDPLAGYILGSFGAVDSQVFAAIGASLCLYSAGLLDNDLADLNEDREERPQRPLPSGAASPTAVAVVAILLVIAGLALAASVSTTCFAIAGALTVCIAFYNHLGKHHHTFGPLNMGLCRGLSVLVGAAAAPHGHLALPLLIRGRLDELLVAAVLTILYIGAITRLAQHETKDNAPGDAKWMPAVMIASGAVAFLSHLPAPDFSGVGDLAGLEQFRSILQSVFGTTFASVLFLFIIAGATAGSEALHLTRENGAPIPPVIGSLIRLMLLLQAAFCVANGSPAGALAATALLILWPISRAVSRRFYAS